MSLVVYCCISPLLLVFVLGPCPYTVLLFGFKGSAQREHAGYVFRIETRRFRYR